ncbi:MAG: hypothetical protein Q8O91_08640, partial [Candidatus Aminicenantes bacterium]|nr:hypothetical protein [Candidatus Aminicenantes bacterium]
FLTAKAIVRPRFHPADEWIPSAVPFYLESKEKIQKAGKPEIADKACHREERSDVAISLALANSTRLPRAQRELARINNLPILSAISGQAGPAFSEHRGIGEFGWWS